MSIKSSSEFEALKEIGGIVRRTLERMALAVAPGVPTAELDEIATESLAEQGAESSPRKVYGFPGTACISVNEEPCVPNYFDNRHKTKLTEGLVLTIEPIIAAGSGQEELLDYGWTIRTADRSLAAHFEHTIVVTRGTPILLTAAA